MFSKIRIDSKSNGGGGGKCSFHPLNTALAEYVNAGLQMNINTCMYILLQHVPEAFMGSFMYIHVYVLFTLLYRVQVCICTVHLAV